MAKKVYDVDGLDMQQTPWDGNEETGGLPVSGRLVEAYIKGIDSARQAQEPTDELAAGETRPPTSGAVAAELTGVVTDVDVTDSEDGTQYVMTVKKKDGEGGETESTVRFSKYTDDDKVIVSIDLADTSGAALPATQYLAAGSGFTVRYTVGVGTAGGATVDGYSDLKARVIVKRGSTVLSAFQNAEFTGVTAGQAYTFDASPYLTDATAYTVQVEAQATYEGQTLTRTATARVTMVAMEMQTTFSVANGITDGGYRNDVNIPFTVKGTTGEKTIYYRLNGGTPYTLGLSSGSGQQSKNVTVALTEMKEGLNVVEVYALHEGSGVMSPVHYITLLKGGDSVRDYAGLMFSHKAAGFQTDWKNPTLQAEQFTAWSFTYTGYSAAANTAEVVISSGGTAVKEDRLLRGAVGTYGRTNVSVEPQAYTVSCGASVLTLAVQTAGHGDIEATLAADAVCTFEAYGRSNSETNAASWESGGKYMQFTDMLWSVNEAGAGSGWTDDRLLLAGGASMTLTSDERDAEGNPTGYRPFNEADKPTGYSIADVGMTLELEYATDNVSDPSAELITCLGQLSNGNRYGLVVTAEEAKFLTGVVTEAMDAGEVLTYEDSVGTKFEPGRNIKVSYVFYPNTPGHAMRGLIGFYVNGVLSASSRWAGKVNFDILSPLAFRSVGADLAVKSLRIYNKALTDDEVLNNYIVDRGHLDDTADEPGVRTLDTGNRVLSEGDTVSLEKLQGFMRSRKNAILMLIGSGSVGSETPADSDTLNIMDALAQLNDKKANKLCREVRFYNGENRALDFIARNVFVRIQGTSSVNYARKNLRFYWQKTASGYEAQMSYGEIDGTGRQTAASVTTGKKNYFRLRPGSVPAALACAKCDFSDSSMTTNTGGAKLIHDGLRSMGLLTPAQRYADDHPDTAAQDIRAAIDGTPCDLFVARSADEDFTYYGQYNMNNEKSDSYPIFGQDEEIGSEKWGEGDTLNYLAAGADGQKQYLPICIETLNNSNDMCLFRWLPSTEAGHTAFLDANFDGGFELNHPKDTFWNSGGGDADEEPNLKEHLGTGDVYDRMYKAIDRMMSFVYRCAKETTACRNMAYNTETKTFDGVDYADTADGQFPAEKWKSETFAREAGQYFDIPYLVAYWFYTEFNLCVDQRAKNMLLRTWDGVKWYTTYYDGDCQLGSDNKSFLTGLYDDNRQTRRDGAYVMQGHNSWLWNLLLANFRDLMEQVMVSGYDGGAPFMSAFSVQQALDHFDTGQMERWCERLYNKSGIFKYIYPFLNPIPVGADGATQTYPQIYGLKGSLEAHRSHFIRRRYDLKQVEYGYVSTLGAQFYQSTASLDAGRVLAPMQFVLTIPYRVQISTSNGVQADSGVVAADEAHTLTLRGAFGENDPLKIIGAAKVRELVWHEDAFALGFNFGLFSSLVKLDMSVSAPSGLRNASFMTATENLALLEELDMTNNLMARNGDSGNVSTLDLSYQSRLRLARLSGTGLTRVTFATGAPLTELTLPDTLEELVLEDLPKLTREGLSLPATEGLRGLRFARCPHIDGLALLEELHAATTAGHGRLERFRLAVDLDDDGSLLEKYYNYKTYTASGANDNAHSGLTGTVRLTRYPSDEDYARWRNRYAYLDIVLPEYTMIEFDDAVFEPANITNLDNQTGYAGTKGAYQPNGHISTILSRRHRCLAKKTAEGEVAVCYLHDADSRYFADAEDVTKATPATLTGAQGDVMMHERAYWYKGVNDLLRKKKYALFSANVGAPPAAGGVVRVELGELTARSGYGLRTGTQYATLAEAEEKSAAYDCYTLPVAPGSRVRFPALAPGGYGAAFADAQGRIVSRVSPAADCGLVDGMYLVADVPEGAASLSFTVAAAVGDGDTRECVTIPATAGIEAVEPDWVRREECLVGVYEASVSANKLRSVSGVQSAVNMSQENFLKFARARGAGYGIIDYENHKDVGCLFLARYGDRDSQGVCGLGSGSSKRTTGLTDEAGMQDTFPNPDNVAEQAAYIRVGEDLKNVQSPNVLGYENWYGHNNEATDSTVNRDAVDYIMRSPMPDGSERAVQMAKLRNTLWPQMMVHGRYMDLLVSQGGGSSSAGYCDSQETSPYNLNCMSLRSGYGGSSICGISYAYNVAYKISISSCTSRLQFRGRIRVITDPAEFLALPLID